MKLTASLIGFLALVLVADSRAGGDKELKKLEGTWVLVSGEQGGKDLPEEVIKGAKLVIKGNKHIVQMGEEKIIGTHELDPTTKPKSIDATKTEGPEKGKKILGIYEIKGDTFKVCFGEPGKDRPKEFTGKAGSDCFVHLWKRVKK